LLKSAIATERDDAEGWRGLARARVVPAAGVGAGPGVPGCWRGSLSARLRDHPGRIPATEVWVF